MFQRANIYKQKKDILQFKNIVWQYYNLKI